MLVNVDPFRPLAADSAGGGVEGHEGHEGQVPGALDGDAQRTLVLGADAGAAARLDLGAV